MLCLNMKKTLNFKRFNEDFFNNILNLQSVLPSPKWYNYKGVVTINEDIKAVIEISLDTKVMTTGQYEGYHVKITSKSKGVLDETYFSFNYYFKGNNRDPRDPTLLFKSADGFLIKDWECKDNIAMWYGQQPTDEERDLMAKEIYEYIQEWI